MEQILKAQSSWSQMRNLDRAVERVNSWPEWKRTAFNYRDQDTAGDSAKVESKSEKSAEMPEGNS